MLTAKCVFEISELQDKAMHLAQSTSPADRQQSSVILSKISMLRETGLATSECREMYTAELNSQLKPSTVNEHVYQKAFESYIKRGEARMTEAERRDLLAGQQSISYTQGVAGGYLVPLLYEKQVFEAVAQTDPLLSADVCSFSMEPTANLQPQVINGYDLSEIVAQNITETSQQTAQAFPTVKGTVLRANIIFKLTIAASFEATGPAGDGDIPGSMAKFCRAFGVGLARKVGQDCITGNGITTLQGLTTAIAPTYTTGTGKITANDLSSIFFLNNVVYRNAPQCAWLMSDSVYQRIRNATDNQNRPLLDFSQDRAMILSRPVYICPTLPAVGGSLALPSQIIFGDLSAYHIRTSRPTIQRQINQAVHGADVGECLYVARWRADAAYFDPSTNLAPPIICATVQS